MFDVSENLEMQEALDEMEKQLYFIKNCAEQESEVQKSINKIYEKLAELENALQE